jgi:hypothetical protein
MRSLNTTRGANRSKTTTRSSDWTGAVRFFREVDADRNLSRSHLNNNEGSNEIRAP